MTKQVKKAPGKPDTDFLAPLGGFNSLNGELFEKCVHASQSLFENAYTLNEEMIRFVGRRFEADLEALQTLSQCEGSEDIVRFQSDFMQTAADDYRTEMAKLLEQGTEAMKSFSGAAAKG